MKRFFTLLLVCPLLVCSCSNDDEGNLDETRPLILDKTEPSILKSYNEIIFATADDSGRFFSTMSGDSFGKNSINSDIISTIDLAFSSEIESGFRFVSPNSEEALGTIEGASKTIYYCHPSEDVMSDEIYESIKEGKDLDALIIEEDRNMTFWVPDVNMYILFKTQNGKKGVMKLVEAFIMGEPYVGVNIKVQL